MALLAVYAALALGEVQRLAPTSNEAWFASPALNLATRGFLGTTILEPAGTWLAGIDRHTYWAMPGHLLAQAACYRLFGFSLFTLRLLSVFWGMVTLGALYAMLWKLSGSRTVALLAGALLAIDARFLMFSTMGRMDIMCAGLGFSALVAYLYLRERSLTGATLAAHSLAAASCLTHPCGVLYAGGLLLATWYYDRRRAGWREMAAAAAPYLLGFSAWGFYILQDPTSFFRQFGGNVSGIAAEYLGANRWSGLTSPLAAFKREYFLRYGSMFGWYERGFSVEHLRLVVLGVYTVGVLGALLTRAIRTHRGFRWLLLLAGGDFCALALLDGLKSVNYLVHTLPLCAALVAVFAVHILHARRRMQRAAVLLVLAGCSAIQIGGALHSFRYQPERWDYAATVDFVERRAGNSSQIIGGAEMAFGLGFGPHLVDDLRLGYFSGKRADYIVTNSIYRDFFERTARTDPGLHAYLVKLLETRYRLVFRNSAYSIYERLGRVTAAGSG